MKLFPLSLRLLPSIGSDLVRDVTIQLLLSNSFSFQKGHYKLFHPVTGSSDILTKFVKEFVYLFTFGNLRNLLEHFGKRREDLNLNLEMKLNYAVA